MEGWKNFFLVKIIVAVISCVCSVLKFTESLWNKRVMGIGSSSQNSSTLNEEKPRKKQSVAKEEKPTLNGQNYRNKKNNSEKKCVDKNKNNVSSTLIKLVESSTQTDNLVSSIKETLKLLAKQTQTDPGSVLRNSFVQTEFDLHTSFIQTDNIVESEINNYFTQTDLVVEEKEIEQKVEICSSSFSQQTETVVR